MAGPWTISRDRTDGEQAQDLRGRLLQVGSLVTNLPAIRRRPARAWWAIPLLTLMTAMAVFLTWATVSLAQAGIAASHAAASISGGPLVAPAPRTAGGLPRRFATTPDPAGRLIMAQLQQRFTAVSAQLLAAARDGGQANPVTTIRPAGLYGEPGHLDPLTSRPSWVMYVGVQSSAMLGPPVDTVGLLMMGFLGKYSKIGPWPVAAGHRGGQANCMITWLGGTEVSVCGWATDRTFGIVASPTHETSVAELAMLLIRMRYDLQRA